LALSAVNERQHAIKNRKAETKGAAVKHKKKKTSAQGQIWRFKIDRPKKETLELALLEISADISVHVSCL
jgi:hypothetical protein